MLLGATATIAGVPTIAFPQSNSDVRRIAWFGGGWIGIKELQAVYERRLADRGWRNGREIAIRLFATRADGPGTPDEREKAAIATMLEWRPTVIVVTGNVYSRNLKRSDIKVPVVFHGVSDPVAEGLVASLRRPGGNFTGVTTGEDVLANKRLELARELLPGARRVAVVYSRANESYLKNILMQMRHFASQLKFELALIDLRSRDGTVNEMLSRIRNARAEAVIPVGELSFNDPTDPNMVKGIKAMLDAQSQAPFIDNDLQSVESGFLVAVGELEADRVRALADITSSVLNGTKPALIPVDQATKIQLWINLKTAKAIGIRVPQSVLVRADRVIE
jgi:putative tryptophan/tyrosine transport system substrate-binding protein